MRTARRPKRPSTDGVVTMPLRISSASRRVAGIGQAFLEAGLKLPDDLVTEAQFSERDGLDATLRLLAGRPRPDAIIACSLRLTTGTTAPGATLVRSQGCQF